MTDRKLTRVVHAGNVPIGGDHPISVQSMVNVPAADFERALAQIKALEEAGCDIVRLAVPTVEDAAIFKYANALPVKRNAGSLDSIHS